MFAELAAKISGAGSEINQQRALGQLERIDGPATPSNVEAEGHDAIDQVVARSDGVEHRLDRRALLFPLREGFIERWQVAHDLKDTLVSMSDEDGSDDRESEVADMARRAAIAASERRKAQRSGGGQGLTVEDVDQAMLEELSIVLEDMAAWIPGFAGAMLFHGQAAQPVVSLITSGDREAMRRALNHVGTSVRMELDLIERDAIGSFVDSVTSTSRGAVLVVRLGDELLVVAIEGQPARVADAWSAIAERRASLREITAKLLPNE